MKLIIKVTECFVVFLYNTAQYKKETKKQGTILCL